MNTGFSTILRILLRLGLLLFIGVLAVGVVFVVQYATEKPREQTLEQEPGFNEGALPSRVVLSLSSAAASIKAAPPGSSITVSSNFDPEVFTLEHRYGVEDDGSWNYRLDFHERTVLHVSVVSIWVGKRSPEVSIELPRGIPLALEVKMEGGYLMMDLAGLTITTADMELDRGVLGLMVSEPLQVPLDRLSIESRIGTAYLKSLGNASPRQLKVHHVAGAASVDLGGTWRQDSEVDLFLAYGKGNVLLPGDAAIAVIGQDHSETSREGRLIPRLRIVADTTAGSIGYEER